MSKKLAIIFLLIAACGFSPQDRYYDEAMRYKAEGENSKAIDSFKKAIAAAPKSSAGKESLYMLGEMYYQAGDYKKAQRIFKLCIDLMDLGSKRKFALLSKMAFISFSKLNEQEQALKYYIKTLDYASSKEEKFEVFLGMGNAYLKIYKFDLATEYFDKAVKEVEKSHSDEMVPKIQEALYYMAFSYQVLSENFSESYLQKGTKPQYRTPADDPTARLLGILDKCISFGDKLKYGVLCKFQKAETLEELGEKGKALAMFTELLDTYPNKAVVESKIDRLR